MKLLSTFKAYGYSNQIGPGVYDIHSPRVPGEQEIKDRIASMLTILPADLLFVNPDCGLKTRQWKETEGMYTFNSGCGSNTDKYLLASLVNLVNAARWARQTYA